VKDSDTYGFPFELPEVKPDGSLSDITLGQVRARRRGNVSMVYPGMLEGSAHLPDRLLVSFSEFTRAVKISFAKADAIFFAWVSAIPAGFVAMILLEKFRVHPATALVAGLGGVAGPVLYVLWKAYLKRWNFYQQTQWLDFTDRHWYSRKHYEQERKPAVRERLAFDELALVCFYRNWEQGIEYEIAICKLSDCVSGLPSGNGPPFLNLIYSDESSTKAFACLSGLSARWGIACYSWEHGAEPALLLFEAKLTPTP
jgi:hypothetical protein